MLIYGIDGGLLLLSTLVFTAIFVLLYWRHILSLFDPLNLFIVGEISASVLMINTVTDHYWWYEFFFFQLAFFLGFSCNALPKASVRVADSKKTPWLTIHPLEFSVLEGAVALLFIVSVVANLYLGATSGFPVFSSDAGVGAKVSEFVGGLGWIKRMNGGMGYFIPCASLVLYVCGRRTRLWLMVAAIETLFVSLSGSKSSIMVLVFMFAYLTHHRGFSTMPAIAGLKKWTKPVMFVAGIWAVTVLAAEGGTWTDAWSKFLVRIVAYGDVVLFYYRPGIIQDFSGHTAFEFIGYVLNPILGMLRLAPYQDPLGYRMVTDIVGERALATILGPNTCFYVAADIFFGPIGGLFYSAVLGYLFSYVRRLFFCKRGLGLIGFTSLFTVSMLVFALPIDTQYFVSLMSDTFLLVFAAIAISYMAVVGARGWVTDLGSVAPADYLET
jgi:hypothetical protein